MGIAIGIAAGKDGSGKTFFASNLGAMLAQGGASVALVDFNVGMRGLDLALGLESEIVYDLNDVFAGEATLRQAETVCDRFDSLTLFSCAQDWRKECPSPEQVKGLYRELKQNYDFVIADLPGGPSMELAGLLSGLDKAVIVVTPEHDTLRNAESVNDILRACGIADRRVLINQVHPEFFAKKPTLAEDVVDLLRIPLLGMLLYDENAYYSGSTGVPLVTEDSAMTDTFRRICLSLVR